MRDGLMRMQTAAVTARDNYTAASNANVAMLGRATGAAQ